MTPPAGPFGVRLAGSGSAVPERVVTNHELERTLDTTDEWIVQRTGIRERHFVDPQREGSFTLSRDALRRALEDAGMEAAELDLVIVASVTAEMTCPSNACRVVDTLGAAPAGAFDLVAACSGFVYAINIADSLIRIGRHRTIGVVGCDAMSTVVDPNDRRMWVLFGDAAGAAVLVRDSDPGLGCLYQRIESDGSMWPSLYMPRRPQEVPAQDCAHHSALGYLRMNGRDIFKFAVTKLRELIEDAMEQTGLSADQVSQVIAHQSNARIIEAAREKLGLPEDKMYVNIDRYGNSSAGSAGLCLDELRRAGRVRSGDHVIFAAIGGGLTWASSVWRL
jgi:3-oxoacyl-[acyl-carrier-protein] synthase-3